MQNGRKNISMRISSNLLVLAGSVCCLFVLLPNIEVNLKYKIIYFRDGINNLCQTYKSKTEKVFYLFDNFFKRSIFWQLPYREGIIYTVG